jgi:hypothetical protein
MVESGKERAAGDIAAAATSEMLRRIQAEFLEMPGLRLTEAQASRLWGLDSIVCLQALIDARFLLRARDGTFLRLDPDIPIKAGRLPRTRRSPAA